MNTNNNDNDNDKNNNSNIKVTGTRIDTGISKWEVGELEVI